ncbi:unnamed protein product [Bursaphelenchus okinawaensis]|uniref:G-patch domain-containing protein n=1 Tax=Bursaphelenchus okinawaensis TaxID=465554 RepID=A0A811K836_9BILA|nr:unnamed protein product [Bursaphelenchus okinawaensis]CAG9093745.1 unnamed protein product [Bursaphelenchus okinawaensis]
MSKEDQIYGIWADTRDEDEDERPSFGKNKPLKFTNFVSGGVSVGSKMEEEEDDNEDNPAPSTSAQKNRDDYVEVSVFQDRKKVVTGLARKNEGFAGTRMRTDAPTWTASSGKGSVIMNMMKKMGYEHGKGLGTNKQGIVEPVVANVRKGRGAVGAYGSEQKGPKFGESAADAQKRSEESVELIEEEVVETGSWKKTKKVRVKYRTLNEVITDGGEAPSAPLPKLKIIDLTGPQERTYDDISDYHKRKPVKQSNKRAFFNVPALTENLNTLLSSCEQEILNTHIHVEDLKAKNRVMEDEQVSLKKDIDDTQDEIDKMDQIIQLIKEFDALSNGLDDLEQCKKLFYRLNTEFSMEARLFNLEAIIQFKILPMISRFFSQWDPLDPEMNLYGYDEMMDWRKLLSAKGVLESKYSNNGIPMFDLLLWDGWMPQIRRAVLRWNPRTNSPQMNSVLTMWSPMLPRWVLDNLFDQIIVPKIAAAVTEWNPVSDEVPLDEWLVPWSDILGDRLRDVYGTVRQKLGVALRHAFAVIKPWSKVFTRTQMRDFLNGNIVPKLETSLMKMNLSPLQNTKYEEFNVVLAWRGLIADDVICRILTRTFFSRWYDMICNWLQSRGNPQLIVQDVANYYREWKARVPQDLHQWPPIQTEFARAVQAIGQVKRGEPLQRMPSHEEFMSSHVVMPEPVPVITMPDPFMPTITQKTLRNHIEQVARTRDIPFVPTSAKSEHGRQIYNLGRKSIYLDGTAIFCLNTASREWEPVSVAQLAHMEF